MAGKTANILILAINDNQFKKVSLPLNITSLIPYYIRADLNGTPAIIVLAHDGLGDSITYDTLVYKFQDLIDCNKTPHKYAKEELTYKTDTLGISAEEGDEILMAKCRFHYD